LQCGLEAGGSEGAPSNPRRNSFGKIIKLHFHPDRDVALNLNNLSPGYLASFNRFKFVRDTLVLS